jgi:agmatinase
MGTVLSTAPDGYDAAIFGAPHGTPYPGIDNQVHEDSPDAFRRALAEDAGWTDCWDFDFGNTLLSHGLAVCDLGNLPTAPLDGHRNRDLIEARTREILGAGAVPIMFGGDDSVPIPFIAAYEHRPIVILQIDAHIDWREERYGERFGFSSTMRRASEHSHVKAIVQAGARGIGSARQGEVARAMAWGAKLVTSRDIHHHGVAPVLDLIPAGSDCVIALDCDALDIAQMPAVVYPTPGGLSYTHVTDLIAGVAAKARIAGFSMVEFVPGKDPAGTSAFTAARIAANVVGQLRRSS